MVVIADVKESSVEKPSVKPPTDAINPANGAEPVKETKQGDQSVERALLLLGMIADADGRSTLSELAEHADLPMPIIHRLLSTLVILGCARLLQDRGYALGQTLMRLGDLAGRQFGHIVRPHLRSVV